VQHFVGDLVNKRGKFFGRLHPGKQGDLAAIRVTLGRANPLREAKLDALRFHEFEQAFAVSAYVAVYFCKGRKVFAFGRVQFSPAKMPRLRPVSRLARRRLTRASNPKVS